MNDWLDSGLKVNPGEIVNGSLSSVELADGTKVNVPVKIARGSQPGPNFVVLTSVHGTEISGVAALIQLFNEINPNSLRGNLIGVMAANPFSLQIGSYVTQYDNLNLAGPWIFPSNPNGTQTPRLGAALQKVLDIADLVVDLHANPLPSIPFLMVDTDINLKDEVLRSDVYKMAQAFGVTIIEVPYEPGNPQFIRPRCTYNGIPAITVELQGGAHISEDRYCVGTIGLKNIMKSFGMLDGDIETQKVEKMIGKFRFMARLHTNRGGLMFIKKLPGEKILQGETVIEIVNIYGDIVESIIMPKTGFCWSFTEGVGGTHAVTEGDNVAYTFEELQ